MCPGLVGGGASVSHRASQVLLCTPMLEGAHRLGFARASCHLCQKGRVVGKTATGRLISDFVFSSWNVLENSFGLHVVIFLFVISLLISKNVVEVLDVQYLSVYQRSNDR